MTTHTNGLESQVKAIKALALTHYLLNNGSFKLEDIGKAEQVLIFITELHKNALTEALNHPDSDNVPELKELKEKGASNV